MRSLLHVFFCKCIIDSRQCIRTRVNLKVVSKVDLRNVLNDVGKEEDEASRSASAGRSDSCRVLRYSKR